MEPVYLRNIVLNEPLGSTADLNAPYSFLEWKQRRPSFSEKDIGYYYSKYVLEWFEKNKAKPISQKFLLRQKYLYLLDQLQLFFSEEEKNTWYSKINLSDEKELLLAIPYFAKKLKNIALYYLKLRKQLKNTKLKYNTVGTSRGIQQEIHRFLLENFSSANKELSPYTQTVIPQFSALQQTLSIEIEEIYDDKNYFDRSLTNPVSSSFNLFHQPTEKYFQTKGISLSSDEWLFNCLSIQPTSNFDSFFETLTGTIFETSDANLYGNFIQTFLAENKSTLLFDTLSSTVEVTEIPINQGDNFFYYPYSTISTNMEQMTPVALSSLVLQGAKGGSTLEDSDVIVVKSGDDIQSAWLYSKEYDFSSKTMKATLNSRQSTRFIYPFPGYGLSGQEIEWTGISLETTKGYEFVSKENKRAIDEAYWSQALPLDSVEPIMLNNSSLVSVYQGFDKNPYNADKIYLRQRTEDISIPQSLLSAAWLFRFDTTALPISPNSTNKILWPYTILGEEYPAYLNKLSFNEVCKKTSVQDLDKTFFIGCSSFELADKIYKTDNAKSTKLEATECCWLSANYTEQNGYGFFNQDGFTALFPAGQATRFIWTGPDNTLLENAFPSIGHQTDCPFVTNIPSVSAFEWQKCTCKQTYYSPFGHPGRLFEENNRFADCIISDTQNQLQSFDFSSWKDNADNNVFNSLEIAWYKTNTKHSWGDGNWISSKPLSPTPFLLEKGKAYFYYRANSRTSSDFPQYSVNYKFLETPQTVWIEAKLNSDGTWSSTNKKSQMFLNAGDFLIFDRQPSTTSYLISSVQVENITENKTGSIWCAFDTIAVGSASNSTTISWPVNNSIPIDETNSIQYPPLSASILDITRYDAWKITLLSADGITPIDSQIIYNTPAVTFVPPATGTYSIAVTATIGGFTPPNGLTLALSSFSVSGIKVYANSDTTGATGMTGTFIPLITAIPQYKNENIQLEFKTPSSGFLIEQPLFGWNYNRNKFVSSSTVIGAKPYWAELYVDKSLNTKFKGAYSWGYPQNYIDGYLPNHQPIISPIELTYGTVVDYQRMKSTTVWKQPLIFNTYVGTSQWCYLSSTTNISNLFSLYTSKQQPDFVVNYNTNPTDIILTNIKNGSPVEIYYHALSSFTWSVSVETEQELEPPTSTVFFNSPKPWMNLPNRFYSTIATLPTLEETYSLEDVGGYFIPQNLGAAQFINKDFTTSLKSLTLSGTFLTEDVNAHVGGRGRTGQDQITLYNWSENNEWLKEPIVSGQLAGSVKKSLTKTLQTFVPYQATTEETALGLVTPKSRVSPWGGPLDEQWTDYANQPQSFTGVYNVSAWVESQVLKQNKKEVDWWTTDIYGNQFALYKELTNVPIAQRPSLGGELWTRTNNQVVYPASRSLSAIYNVFPSTIQNTLTQNTSIKQIDCFFDNLMIELPNDLLFVKLNYDYETSELSTTYDDVVSVSLDSSHKRFDRTWFFPETKNVITLFTNLSNSSVIPELWELDLNSLNYTKVFPVLSDTSVQLSQAFETVNVASIERASLYFNKTLQQYLITYRGTTNLDKFFILDFIIEKQENLILKEINWYLPGAANGGPPVVPEQYLTTYNSQSISSIQVNALNNPTQYSLLNYQSNVTVSNTGLFAYNLPRGLHHVNYKVSNNVGSSMYCLTLFII